MCTRIFYSNTSKKFIFLPICAISFKNKKIDTNEKYYKETYNRIIGNDEVIEICDIYCGEWVGCINKNGEYLEGRYSCYHKTNKVLVYNYNGLNFDKYISPNIESIIIYTTDILGNRYVRVDTRNIL